MFKEYTQLVGTPVDPWHSLQQQRFQLHGSRPVVSRNNNATDGPSVTFSAFGLNGSTVADPWHTLQKECCQHPGDAF
eukprot:1161327-Pelagomonas_calceolata.AAC.3